LLSLSNYAAARRGGQPQMFHRGNMKADPQRGTEKRIRGIVAMLLNPSNFTF
jgi:hypothetical protein